MSTALNKNEVPTGQTTSSAISRKTLLLWALTPTLIVILLMLCNYALLHDKSDTVRGTFGDMFGAVNALFSGLAFAGVILAIVLQCKELEFSRKEFIDSAREQRVFYAQERVANAREATQTLYDRWWSQELADLRHYFYTEFVPNRAALIEKCDLRNVHVQANDEKRHIARLTGFFDYVGWLGAAGLIDVDYVLGPMQHVVRKVWFATQPLIERARYSHDGIKDPAFRMGFEWLFIRSEILDKDHASILASAFNEPALLSDLDVVKLRKAFQEDELEFKNSLDAQALKPQNGHG